MMPIFSGYWTWYYAAGLALYWNVGNFIMMGQQLIINQSSMGREMRQIQTERAARKAKAAAGKLNTKVIQGRR
jgi:YidC/Oxa1 family membrane protein insertase